MANVMRQDIINVLQSRIASGAGLQNHSVYGQPRMAGTGKKKAKKAAPKKKKVVCPPCEQPVKMDVEDLAVGEVMAGKKKRKVKSAKASAAGKKAAASNPWIKHIKMIQARDGISYKEAWDKAKISYKK